MDIRQATKSYEAWMHDCINVVESELTWKHAQMRIDSFMFFRGTYYRWAQLWPEVCNDLRNAPKLLGVGDLHVGSYGTWRDSEGRLCWGIDDFDDSYPLPYTSDLVRLAASVKMLTDSRDLAIKFRDGCDAILEGYEDRSGRRMSFRSCRARKESGKARYRIDQTSARLLESPASKPVVSQHQIPPGARKALEETMPPKVRYKVVRRKAGMGSLGQLRFVAIAMYEGGYVAREAKATVPSASVWKEGKRGQVSATTRKRSLGGTIT